MSTILVVYTHQKNPSPKDLRQLKKYAFNTSSDAKPGDVIESGNYNTPMLVTDRLTETFRYYNSVTGDLSHTLNSTRHHEIATLKILPAQENVIYGTIKTGSSAKPAFQP